MVSTPPAPPAPPAPTLHSPRLVALQQHVRDGVAIAVERFWASVEEEGTPLVEPIEGDGAHYWVTFLWRGGEDTKNVALIGCYLVHPHWRDDRDVLRRLDGTDV